MPARLEASRHDEINAGSVQHSGFGDGRCRADGDDPPPPALREDGRPGDAEQETEDWRLGFEERVDLVFEEVVETRGTLGSFETY